MSADVRLDPSSTSPVGTPGPLQFFTDFTNLLVGTNGMTDVPQAGASSFPRQSPPLAATSGIGAITGSMPDLSSVEFYRIDQWSNVGGIVPPISAEAIAALSQNRDLAGQAFTQGGRNVAIVENATVAESAARYGVTAQRAGDYWATQEIAHAYFAANYDGELGSGEYLAASELFGEAASANVDPRMATLIAMNYLAVGRQGSNEGYDAYLDIAETSLNETLTQAGIPDADGRSPGERFTAGLQDALRNAGGAPFHQVYDRYVDTFVRENAPPGSGIDAAQLRASIQSNYVTALTDAAREVAP